jgi:hypothetical protein
MAENMVPRKGPRVNSTNSVLFPSAEISARLMHPSGAFYFALRRFFAVTAEVIHS